MESLGSLSWSIKERLGKQHHNIQIKKHIEIYFAFGWLLHILVHVACAAQLVIQDNIIPHHCS